jgi:hypothetical protein
MALDLPPQAGPARDAAILARAGDLSFSWRPITSSAGSHTAEFRVFADAAKLDGVRINASARLMQQLADRLSCSLLTPRLADLMWAQRRVTVDPFLMPISASTDAMVRASAAYDATVTDFPGLLGKTWCVDNALLLHPGRAENYGLFVLAPGGAWRGLATEACVSLPPPNRVIQGRGWAHDIDHVDYSQLVQLVSLDCTVDGRPMKLHEVAASAELAPLVNHAGVMSIGGGGADVLRVLRQPGVDALQPLAIVASVPWWVWLGGAAAAAYVAWRLTR